MRNTYTGDETILPGGSMTGVVRVGATIHRTAGSWTLQIHRLLTYLREHGMDEVPEPLGFDDQGREVLSFLPGAAGITLTPALRTDEVIIQAARMLRRMHDTTADIAPIWLDGWQSAAVEPVEVICHGDFAPYNCLFENGRLTGVIDFDNAHPGRRLEDIASALYRFSPLTAPTNPEHFGSLAEQCRRGRLFCAAYGLEERTGLVEEAKASLDRLADGLRKGAAQGDERYLANIQAGHLTIYENDLANLSRHREEYRRGLL